MNDCRFGVSPVNNPDPDPDSECKFIKERVDQGAKRDKDWLGHIKLPKIMQQVDQDRVVQGAS